MLDFAHTLDVFPVVSFFSSSSVFTPADLKDISYSPAFLLPVHFSSFIGDSLAYGHAYEDGFNSYFDDMLQENKAGTDFQFIARFYTRAEIMQIVAENMVTDFQAYQHDWSLFSYNSGFVVGWLSALALTDCASALAGLAFLTVLIAQLQKVFS